MSNGIIILKRPYISLIIGSSLLEPLNVKTTPRKSCLENLLQVSNLIYDPCIKVQLGHLIKKAFYLPYY